MNAPASLPHPRLVRLLKLAYSAERAAALAYIGHANSVRDPVAKAAIRQIELDEWRHRETVLGLMNQYGIAPSRYFEIQFFLIGRVLSLSCHLIGWFMPYYFAGRLESGNVCEYFIMQRYFHELGITAHDEVLQEMGIKEKEHEVYFQESLKNSRLLPLFERIFGWGPGHSSNDVDLQRPIPPAESTAYCRHRP
ncbi:MAG: ferritin-like domain-containing protein [Planctomycetaceae bacterium]